MLCVHKIIRLAGAVTHLAFNRGSSSQGCCCPCIGFSLGRGDIITALAEGCQLGLDACQLLLELLHTSMGGAVRDVLLQSHAEHVSFP